MNLSIEDRIAVAGHRLVNAQQEHIEAADDLYLKCCALRYVHSSGCDYLWTNLSNAMGRYDAKRQSLRNAVIEHSHSGEPKS